MAEPDLSLAIEIARARARATTAKENNRKITREVPAWVADVNRFEANRRMQEQQEAEQKAVTRPLGAMDYAFNMLPMGPVADPRTRAAIGEGLTLGIPSAGMAGVDALTAYLTGEGPTFGEALDQRQDEARFRRAYAPGMATMAELGAGTAVGGGLGRAAQRGLNAVAPSFAARPIGEAVAQGAAGAAEGAGYSAITGEGDPLTSAIFGGLFGAGAGLVAPMTGQMAEEAARRDAAERLFGETTNANLGRDDARPLDLLDLISRRRELGPEATIADLDPLLGASVRGAFNPATAPAAAPLIAAASSRTRPVADILMDDIDAAIAPSYGKVARAEDRAAIIEGARIKYDAALDKMRQDGFTVDVNMLRNTIKDSFGTRGVTTSTPAAARDRMLAELDRITGYRPPRYNRKGEVIDPGDPGKTTLTVDESLALKKEFDNMVSDVDPTKSVRGETRATVINVKNILNEQLKTNPDFADAAKIYADEFDIDNAYKFANEVFKGNYSADDFAKLFGQMSDVEQAAVARAARDEIQIKFFDKPGGAERFARRVGPTQDAAFTQKLDTIFGADKVDKLYEAAMRARAFGGTARVLDEATMMSQEANARGVGGGRGVGTAADILTVGQQAAQGRATSGATAGSIRRLLLEQKKASNEAVQRQMLSYLGQQGQSADEALMEVMSYLYGTAPPRMVNGVGGAVGGAAGVGMGGYTGPETPPRPQ